MICLFNALNVATSQVTDACYPMHRHEEFLRFLKKVSAAYPDVQLHVVCDNYGTDKHASVKAWLAMKPQGHLALHADRVLLAQPRGSFSSVITRQTIRHGSVHSVRELTATIGAFIDSWNDHPHPFAWTRTPTRS